MASETGNSNAPDSWDQDVKDETCSTDANELSKPLSALNVNAPAFVPGKNVFAREFVPKLSPSDADESPEAPIESSMPITEQDTEIMESVETDEDKGGGKDQETADEEKDQETADDDAWAKGEDEDVDVDDELDLEEMEGLEEEDVILHPELQAVAIPKKKDASKGPPKVKKEHVNVVFIGHVDAGKSTIGGHIMYLTGQVDKRTLEKYEREAKEKNRETWYLSWALDTNLEEREKGKTVEVGRAFFETTNKHFTILDAPGHKSFVPNMIGGASQADVAVLVISARRGEFETGFERGGQTREHAMLVKTSGVKHLIVVINKMDDPTVEWAEDRYIECRDKLIPYLKKCGFNPKTDLFFLPVSGLNGAFLKDVPDEKICPWYRGPSLIDYLDSLPPISRAQDQPVRVPIVDRYKDMGSILLGKVESGVVSRNQTLFLMPNRMPVKVMTLWSDDEETDSANPGENVKIKVSGIEEEDVSPGFVLCPVDNVCHTGKVFDAQIVILEHKSIICAGYSAVMHIHSCAEEVTIKALICIIDKKTGEKTKLKPKFIKQDQIGIARLEVNGGVICMETFKEFPQMGRFTLRDEGRTVAIGKVLKVIE
ncbi:hypothetical protein CHS0354_033198 [Potamilus streckersoni]|uniref:Tr-type G domain-containing protein n=1 Tax=Potamilus streckersoni TaxID=2493646 RepID=A0AAE0S696_9BIVA|nr:hypothetical protein CHS0354_033198 [Potamilus streckersoni]